ncbi:MAG: radical SAM family heme chaperone HemW, partial [Myxococcota bacterium]
APSAGGVYVHFPYCKHHCAYCDFAVATPKRIPQREFTDAVLAELALRGPSLGGPARTLYIGGGTPSLWEPAELGRFVEALRRSPGLDPGAEFTLEANPAEVSPERVAAWRDLGVTRISLGVQALDEPMLRSADRLHDLATAERALKLIATAGFASWSFDLIFGLARQTLANWEATLTRALSFSPPHLSVYALTVEPRTVLARQVRDGKTKLPGDSLQARMLFAARERLRAAGMVHYEVSSYALPGHRAVHNSSYWEMRPYLGLGPGAHGFIAPERRANVRRPSVYIQRALAGDPTESVEPIDPETLAFERVMTGLRDLERGVDLAPDLERFFPAAQAEARAGRLRLEGSRAWLTEDGLRLMDSVLLRLLG